MTLTYHRDNSELFQNIVLWWQGRDQTATGFPILPTGVTVTPNGSWTDLTTGVTRSVKSFNGTDAYITMTDNAAWDFGSGDFAITFWFKVLSSSNMYFCGQATSNGTGGPFQLYISSNKLGGSMNPGTAVWLTGRNTVYTNTWYFAYMMRSGTTGSIGLASYLMTDLGIEDSDTVSGTLVASDTVFGIGKLGLYASGLMNGSIKDLMIYKGRALIQPEIIEIMRLTNPASGRDFAAIYPGNRAVE